MIVVSALEVLVVDDGALERLLLELVDEKRDQGHPLDYVAMRVSNVKGRCVVVVLLHVQGLVDFRAVGSEQIDQVRVQ